MKIREGDQEMICFKGDRTKKTNMRRGGEAVVNDKKGRRLKGNGEELLDSVWFTMI